MSPPAAHTSATFYGWRVEGLSLCLCHRSGLAGVLVNIVDTAYRYVMYARPYLADDGSNMFACSLDGQKGRSNALCMPAPPVQAKVVRGKD